MQGEKGRLGLPSRHAMGGWFWEVEEDGCQKSSKTSAKTAAALRTCFAEREVVFRVVRAQHRVVVCWQRRLRRRALVQRAVLGFSTKKNKKNRRLKRWDTSVKLGICQVRSWHHVCLPCQLSIHTHTNKSPSDKDSFHLPLQGQHFKGCSSVWTTAWVEIEEETKTRENQPLLAFSPPSRQRKA